VNSSFSIFRVLGIEVRLHVLFVYLVALLLALGVMNGSLLGTATVVGMLFGLVLVHELGHSLMARRFGVRVVDIVLWPLGGMARMAEIPEEPKVEGWIAAAGPLVNLGLALPALALHLVLFGSGALLSNPLARPLASLADVSACFVLINAMLGLFNLLPAFPMDGGRVLRAILAARMGWLAGTERAVRVGRIVAWAMILSILVPSLRVGLGVPLIGVFVLWEGMRELWATRLRHATAGPAFDLASLFRAPGGSWGNGHGSAPPRDASFEGTLPSDAPHHRGGFSDEDIRRLEQHPGRLRRPFEG